MGVSCLSVVAALGWGWWPGVGGGGGGVAWQLLGGEIYDVPI